MQWWQQRQNRRGVDFEAATNGLRERPCKRGVGQLIELVRLEQLKLARHDLDGRCQRRDVQTLRLARLSQQAARGGRTREGGSAGVARLTHRSCRARKKRLLASRGTDVAADLRTPAHRSGYRGVARCAQQATTFANRQATALR